MGLSVFCATAPRIPITDRNIYVSRIRLIIRRKDTIKYYLLVEFTLFCVFFTLYIIRLSYLCLRFFGRCVSFHSYITISVDVNKAYTNRYPNNLPVDIVGLLLSDDDDYDFLFYTGRMGKTSDYLPELMPDYMSHDDWSTKKEEGYPNPNTTIEEFYYSIKWSDDNLVMSYTFDKDNYLTGIQTKIGFSVMKTTYTVTVGSELVDPNFPERGYKYETKDYKTAKVKDDADVFNWTIEY